jgi:hypothetical protein
MSFQTRARVRVCVCVCVCVVAAAIGNWYEERTTQSRTDMCNIRKLQHTVIMMWLFNLEEQLTPSTELLLLLLWSSLSLSSVSLFCKLIMITYRIPLYPSSTTRCTQEAQHVCVMPEILYILFFCATSHFVWVHKFKRVIWTESYELVPPLIGQLAKFLLFYLIPKKEHALENFIFVLGRRKINSSVPAN